MKQPTRRMRYHMYPQFSLLLLMLVMLAWPATVRADRTLVVTVVDSLSRTPIPRVAAIIDPGYSTDPMDRLLDEAVNMITLLDWSNQQGHMVLKVSSKPHTVLFEQDGYQSYALDLPLSHRSQPDSVTIAMQPRSMNWTRVRIRHPKPVTDPAYPSWLPDFVRDPTIEPWGDVTLDVYAANGGALLNAQVHVVDTPGVRSWSNVLGYAKLSPVTAGLRDIEVLIPGGQRVTVEGVPVLAGAETSFTLTIPAKAADVTVSVPRDGRDEISGVLSDLMAISWNGEAVDLFDRQFPIDWIYGSHGPVTDTLASGETLHRDIYELVTPLDGPMGAIQLRLFQGEKPTDGRIPDSLESRLLRGRVRLPDNDLVLSLGYRWFIYPTVLNGLPSGVYRVEVTTQLPPDADSDCIVLPREPFPWKSEWEGEVEVRPNTETWVDVWMGKQDEEESERHSDAAQRLVPYSLAPKLPSEPPGGQRPKYRPGIQSVSEKQMAGESIDVFAYVDEVMTGEVIGDATILFGYRTVEPIPDSTGYYRATGLGGMWRPVTVLAPGYDTLVTGFRARPGSSNVLRIALQPEGDAEPQDSALVIAQQTALSQMPYALPGTPEAHVYGAVTMTLQPTHGMQRFSITAFDSDTGEFIDDARATLDSDQAQPDRTSFATSVFFNRPESLATVRVTGFGYEPFEGPVVMQPGMDLELVVPLKHVGVSFD